MNARHIISFLLILAISLATAVHPTGARAMSLRVVAAEDEQRLTPEEELEAREFVSRVIERLKTTHDIGPLIDDLFVKDFTERLRQSPQTWLPWFFLDKALIATSSDAELRRFYVASLNFYGLFYEIFYAVAQLKKQAEGNEEELKLEDALTPEIISTLMSDPVIAELAQEFKKDEEDGTAKKEDGNQSPPSGDPTPSANPSAEADNSSGATEEREIGSIKTSYQLNSVSTTLEKTSVLMRKRLASLPQFAPNTDDTESQKASTEFDLLTLDEGEYGYPHGTQTIHVNILPFCLHIIRANGQLKLLTVSIFVD